MRLPSRYFLLCAGLLACGAAPAQPAPRAAKPLVPVSTAPRATPSSAIIVQGGLSPDAPCNVGATGTYSDGVGSHDLSGRAADLAIGPKQDDPRDPRPTPARDAASGIASGRAALAIGPKQDDPVGPRPPSRDAGSGIATGRGALAIGPKQDDPAPPPPADVAKCMPASH